MLRDQKSADKFFNSPAFHLIRKCLIVVGGWPYLRTRTRVTVCLIVNFIVYSSFLAELTYIIEIIDNMQKVIFCLMPFIITLLCIILSINSVIKLHPMKRLLDTFRENWENLQNDGERKIFETYAHYGKIFTVCLSVCYYTNLVTYILSPLVPPLLDYRVTGNWTVPERNVLEVEFFVDPAEYYWPIFVHGAQAASGVVTLLLAYDLFYITIVLHCCAMFDILQYKIEKMDEEIMLRKDSIADKRHDQRLAVKNIEKIVMYHLSCLDFVQKIEDYFSMQSLIQLLANTIVISVCGSQVIKLADKSLQESCRYAFMTCTTVFRLTFLNAFGQGVSERSDRIYNRLIDTTWYEYPIETRKLFIILYNRSAEPCNLTAARLINLNFVTCTQLLKSAMSYFMMIIQT